METYDWIQNNQTYQQEIFKSLDYFCLVFNWLDNNDLTTVQYLSSAWVCSFLNYIFRRIIVPRLRNSSKISPDAREQSPYFLDVFYGT